MQNPLRRQLPVHSPLGFRAAVSAAAQVWRIGSDPRPEVTALLQREYRKSGVLLCGSGTQALTIAIREARRRTGPKQPVAIPAFSCFDVATAVIGAGAPVILYDLDPDTLAPEQRSFETALREGAGIAVIAPLYGIPVDWPALAAIAARHDVTLIEDAAQGHAARWDAKPLGSLGEISVLSFGRGKGWTGGSGGAVLTSAGTSGLAETVGEAGVAKSAGIAAALIAQLTLARPAVYQVPCSVPALRLGETTYSPPRPLRSLTRGAAAALLATHKASAREGEQRRQRATELLSALDGLSRRNQRSPKPIIPPTNSTPGYLRLPVRLPKGMGSFSREDRALRLGIAPSYPLSLAQLPELAGNLSGPPRRWPGADTLVRELVTLPTHSRVTAEDQREILEVLGSL